MMKKAAILLAVFGVFLVFGGCRVEAASYQTFYRDYDERVRTKEQYLAKLEKSREMRATREEILHSARFAFRRDFTSWKEYREFIRGEEVTVAPCTFKDTRVDYLVLRPRGIGQQRRDHRKRELCLRHQGGDRISLLCGQGIMKKVLQFIWAACFLSACSVAGFKQMSKEWIALPDGSKINAFQAKSSGISGPDVTAIETWRCPKGIECGKVGAYSGSAP